MRPARWVGIQWRWGLVRAAGCLAAGWLAVLGGCGAFNAEQVRYDQTLEQQTALAAKAERLIEGGRALTLDDCVRIALENNLDVQAADMQRRIARLDRKVAFAAFLPQVNLNYSYTRWDPQPEILFGGGSMPMHDRRIREVTWQIQMSVFNPTTWFLYAMHVHGEQIAELAADYTRRMIVLQVTTLYYYCLGLEEVDTALASQVRAAEALVEQVRAFQAEGLALDWQLEQAQVALTFRRTQRRRVEQVLDQVRGELLSAMGLSPLASIRLCESTGQTPPDAPLEVLAAEALLNHPQLRIADRQVAIEREKVHMALANFLPSLVGLANHVNTSDSFQRYANVWMTGVAGVMTVFNGFANLHEYEAAKQRVAKAALEREQQALVVMLQVLRAQRNLEGARDEMRLAAEQRAMAEHRYQQTRRQWAEGLVDTPTLLSVLAERDQAQMFEATARFQWQVAAATLENAIGRIPRQMTAPTDGDGETTGDADRAAVSTG